MPCEDWVCLACGAGKGDSAPGSSNEQSHCIACPAGSVTDTLVGTGATSCSACSVGQISTDSTVDCTACEVGQYQNSTGQTECSSCISGIDEGTTCPVCVAGYWEDASGACTACDAGQYQPRAGQSGCVTCAPGSVTDSLGTTGAVRCTACTAGQYSVQSTVSCAECEPGSVTDLLALAASTTCTTT